MESKILSLLLLTAPLAAVHPQGVPHNHSQVNHRLIDGVTLRSWYNENKPMIVIDARSKPYFDGTLLPDAKWIVYDTPEQELMSALPSKDATIVVYCAGPNCPASGWLYDRLSNLGYTNLYEYHDGIQDWMQRGYPTSQQ